MTRPCIDLTIFGLFLEAKRVARGLTRSAIAREAGVPTEAVRMATDKQKICRGSFLKLCARQGEEPAIFERRAQ